MNYPSVSNKQFLSILSHKFIGNYTSHQYSPLLSNIHLPLPNSLSIASLRRLIFHYRRHISSLLLAHHRRQLPVFSLISYFLPVYHNFLTHRFSATQSGGGRSWL
ncbi:hypothetical protein MtrunA17_Chr5g0399511 [Medicago truncatula]|uniref:Uncharacterized protein n=1 Tax=Medicago truncatula TaxID=3880 RepID=A0A396HKF4_MEDTR|nr:hypothetical protein MtrunA17_Chr5g0399511 [Medicago truncatula]